MMLRRIMRHDAVEAIVLTMLLLATVGMPVVAAAIAANLFGY